MNPAKAKNWTSNRPFTIPASERSGAGRGSLKLYSIQDVYLMALANEFSKAGFAAAAIGKLVDAMRNRFPDLAILSTLTVWRRAQGDFMVRRGRIRPAAATLWVAVDVAQLVQTINRRAAE